MPKKINILDVSILATTKREFLKNVEEAISKKKHIHIITVNTEMIVEVQKNKEFRQLLKTSSNIADGVGLLWAAKFNTIKSKNPFIRLVWLVFTGSSLVFSPGFVTSEFPEQIRGRKLWLDLCRLAQEKKIPVFLLGRKSGLSTFEKVNKELTKKFPRLKVDGDFSWRKNPSVAYYKRIDKQIPKNAVVFSSLGHPEQDLVFSKLKSNNNIQIGVGGSFDFLIGKQKTAPKIFSKLGVEWLYRLILQPRRIKRIWNATAKFIWLVWKNN